MRLPGARICGSTRRMIAPVFDAGANKSGKKRVRREWLGLKFRVELAPDKPGMIGHFDDFDVHTVRRATRDAEARARQNLGILGVEFVAVPMPLGDFTRAISLCRKRTRLEL